MAPSPILGALPSLTAAAKNNAAAFRAAGQAMAELGAAGGVGASCVQFGLVTPESVRVLSRAVFSIFLPMFLGTSIARTVSTYGINRSSLAVPLATVLHCSLMFALSRHVLLPLFGMEYDDDTNDGSGHVLARATSVSCSFGNSGVLPLLFAEALFREPYEPSDVQPRVGAGAACVGYISLYLVGWSPFFWSFGRSVLLGRNVGVDGVDDEDGLDSTAMALRKVKRLFPPPVIGVVVGMLVATSPLRHVFLGSGAPLAVVYNCFQNLGRAAAPVALLVLTSSLAFESRSGANQAQVASAEDGRTLKDLKHGRDFSLETVQGISPLQRWACVSTARFVVSPLLMMGVLKCFHKIGMIKSAEDESVLWFVLILESCMPPAQNSILMMQVANRGREASQMARFLFGVYVTGMLPVVLVLSLALQRMELAR